MAGKKHNKPKGKKETKGVRSEGRGELPLSMDSGYSRTEIAMFCAGFVILFFTFYVAVSLGSYLFTGAADFSILENPSYEDMRNEDLHFQNYCGSLGAVIAYSLMNRMFGLASFLWLPLMLMLAAKLMSVWKATWLHFLSLKLNAIFVILWTSVLLSSISQFTGLDDTFINPGGNHGRMVVKTLVSVIGQPGLFGCLALVAFFYLIYTTSKTIEYIRKVMRLNYLTDMRIKERINRHGNDLTDVDGNDGFEQPEVPGAELDGNYAEPSGDIPDAGDDAGDAGMLNGGEGTIGITFDTDDDVTPEPADETDVPDTVVTEPITIELDNVEGEQHDADSGNGTEGNVAAAATGTNATVKVKAEADTSNEFAIQSAETERGNGNIRRGSIDTPYDPKLDLELYKYPPVNLLDKSSANSPLIDYNEQNANKDQIIKVLRSFGVEIRSIRATIGPTITLYEITPAEGMRISRIRNLEDDIALSLAAEGIRIIAPIPGKGTIGIEVPNKKKCIVTMESVINSRVYQESNMELPCALGKTITNEVFMFDLAKAPHLLVAGATGQGKSVGLNAIVASLLYKKHPSELKIVMVDPKKVEFSIYAPIENHFLARLEDEDECIITDVQKVTKTLNSLCVLMDSRYDLLKRAGVRNIKEYNAKFKARQLNPEHGHEFMPYIVVIIDEFGDLIMTAGKEIELPICRIAQLARAVGIHMIIATQRPTTQIISGAIKTNFPTRIAFKVSAMIDSKVILDRTGANQLIGHGDLLYLQGSEPVRVQCAFIDTPEVQRVTSYIAGQQAFPHPMYLPDVDMGEGEGSGMNSVDVKRLDPMFAEIATFVVTSQSGSTSQIQRNYSIGYNRAGKIMDQLERMGVVGPQNGAKPREVLIKDRMTLESILNNL